MITTRTDDDDGTFEAGLRIRLRLLIEQGGRTIWAVEKSMGRAKGYLYRKLRPLDDDGAGLNEPRALKAADVDAVLAHLGLDRELFLRPLLLPGDAAILAWVPVTAKPTVRLAEMTHPAAQEAIARLEAQRLIRVTPGGQIRLTPDGDEIVRIAQHTKRS